MNIYTRIFSFVFIVGSLASCENKIDSNQVQTSPSDSNFQVNAESFADLQVLRYQVPGFEDLSLQQKQLAYYLYEASLSGRDIYYDQVNQYGLILRKTIEAIFNSYTGDKTSDNWKQFHDYAGRVWFSTGNYHHYGKEKFMPECSFDYFEELIQNTDQNLLPLESGETKDSFWKRIKPIVYDLNFQPRMVDLSAGVDNVVNSSNNFYENITHQEVDSYYGNAILFPHSDREPE